MDNYYKTKIYLKTHHRWENISRKLLLQDGMTTERLFKKIQSILFSSLESKNFGRKSFANEMRNNTE